MLALRKSLYGVTFIGLGTFMGLDQGDFVLGEVILSLEVRFGRKSSFRPRVSGRLAMGILTMTCLSESVLPLRLLSLLLDPDHAPELGLLLLPLLPEPGGVESTVLPELVLLRIAVFELDVLERS